MYRFLFAYLLNSGYYHAVFVGKFEPGPSIPGPKRELFRGLRDRPPGPRKGLGNPNGYPRRQHPRPLVPLGYRGTRGALGSRRAMSRDFSPI